MDIDFFDFSNDSFMSGMDSDLLTDADSKQLDLLKDEEFMCMSPEDVALALNANVHPAKNNGLGLGVGDLTGSVISAVDEFPSLDSSWDQDVLLSNAVLPETNPLLELDNSIEEDFQQVLNEWESHIGALQSTNSEMSVDEESVVQNATTNPSSQNVSEPMVTDGDSFFESMEIKASLAGSGCNLNTKSIYDQPLLSTSTIAPSTPSMGSYSPRSSCSSYPSLATPPPVIPVPEVPPTEIERPDSPTPTKLRSRLVSTDDNGTTKEPRLTLGKKTLAGIVISSGPGGHFETYEGSNLSTASSLVVSDHRTNNASDAVDGELEVLEASDVDNLLDQFEAVENIRKDLTNNSNADPERASHIVAAVKSHFSGSNRNFPKGKVPKIVASQRIKDALPREIVDKIKASSQRSKTIAIIEPVQKSKDLSTVASSVSGSSCESPSFNTNLNSSHRVVAGPPGKGGMASRFQEAAASMNRSKYRHFGINGGIQPTPQQVQVSLDHDYCSSNKSRRNNRVPSQQQQQTSPHRLATYSTGETRHRVIISSGSGLTQVGPSGSIMPLQQNNRAVIRVSRAPVLKRAKELTSHLVALSKPSGTYSPIQISSPITISPASIHSSHSPLSSSLSTSTSLSSPITLASCSSPKVPLKVEPPSPTSNHELDLHDDSSAPSPRTSQRRDSDPKKDSGLESGDVSDASNIEDEHLYSRLPAYLTTLPAKEGMDELQLTDVGPSDIKLEKEDMTLYDRLPTYVTGLSRTNSTETCMKMEDCIEMKPDPMMLDAGSATSFGPSSASCVEGGGAIKEADLLPGGVICDNGISNLFKPRRSLRSRQSSRSCSRSSSRSSSTSSFTANGNSDSETNLPDVTGGPLLGVPTAQKPFHVVTRSSTAAKRCSRKPPSTMSPSKALSSFSSNSRSASLKRRRDRSTSSTSSNSSRFRSRSPLETPSLLHEPHSARRSSKRNRNHPRSLTTQNPKGAVIKDMEQYRREEKKKQVEERRVVYVGKICESTSRASLRSRFEVFGPIEEISVHFRDRGDNYGFVTFKNKLDAYEAVEHGNDDPNQSKVDLCFGGRRSFCKTKYSDLDSLNENEGDGHSQQALDFDSLLRQAKASYRK
ncbi:serine-rich adhesin for platelets-like isoform X3 [Tigriopus californicus]|uniref:serine-rich adhesin for platelets-like isoform X3 n=1 Tax=Tigriopus californicus TaxID=6832 RepID=UPI0027DA3198|nr:serine-rich adhesin for platelets-like isoform X3 [Tigriopus californicus]